MASEAKKSQVLTCVSDLGDRLFLTAIVKRTYAYDANGRLTLADVQDALLEKPSLGLDEHGLPSWLEDDADVIAPKPATDVVVKGAAFSLRAQPQWAIAVGIGTAIRSLQVYGERFIDINQDRLKFTTASAVHSVPLRWQSAYGGYDSYAQNELSAPPQRTDYWRGAREVRKQGLFGYPRNRVGMAYFIDVDRKRAAGAMLPRIEDPADPLTPERFFVPKPRAWIDAPLPGSLGWVAHPWYPRGFRLLGETLRMDAEPTKFLGWKPPWPPPGVLPIVHFQPHDPPQRVVREACFPDGQDLPAPSANGHTRVHPLPRAVQGASPGLAVERWRGDEPILLRGLDAETSELRFDLPGEYPRCTVRPAGTRHTFDPVAVLQTLRIDTEQRRLSLTFCSTVRLVAPLSPKQLTDSTLIVNWGALAR